MYLLRYNFFFILIDKIPQEIFYWKLKDRKTYVKSMKKGKISVYNGRGMVIGCARAGKSTLVKKLRGEKDLNTKSISRIRVHSHLFKLNENESTITGKHFLLYILSSKLRVLIISQNKVYVSISMFLILFKRRK